MDKKGNILKIIIAVVCLAAVTLFALIESGITPTFVQNYKNNFKKNVSGICNMLNIELPIETQLYLDDMSTPTPKPTMAPASEQSDIEELYADIPELVEEIQKEASGTAELTTKAPEKAVKTSDAFPIAFDSAVNSKFAYSDGKILCVNETSYSAYSQDGKLIFEQKIQMQKPVLVAKGEYVMISETGAKKICLYKGKKLLFETKTEGNIITADMSEKGDIVVVTEKEYYKGQVAVFNKSGDLIFAWDSGSYDILDADISQKRSLAVSLLNTDSGADTYITCFDLNGKVKYKTDIFANAIIFDVEYNGENLNAFSESKCMGISSKGKVAWEYDYGGKRLLRYQMAQNGYKVFLFDAESTGEIVPVSAGGKVYSPIKTENMPDIININSNCVAYNSGRDVIITDFKGKRSLRAVCDSDIKQIYIINSKRALCVYTSSIQIKKLERHSVKKSVSASPEPTTDATISVTE